jgi:hypothetical protein
MTDHEKGDEQPLGAGGALTRRAILRLRLDRIGLAFWSALPDYERRETSLHHRI